MARADHSLTRSVHVWHVPVDLHRSVDEALLARLQTFEQQRASLHHSPEALARYVTVRLALRRILGRYTGCMDDAVILHTTDSGKPTMLNSEAIHFSISHARDAAIIAVADTPVGVDMEYIRTPHRLERTAVRVLHADTVALLQSLPDEQRVTAFFEAWTQREAHVKAVGGGLFRTPDTIPFQHGLDINTPRTVRDRATDESWSVARLPAAGDMRASVTALGPIDTIMNLDWMDDHEQ